MSNPNTDRDERVRQIRERQEERRTRCEHTVKNTNIPLPTSIADIDYLLSLLDSQAVDHTRPFGWISCRLRQGRDDRIVDIVFENAECAKAFIDRVEPVAGPVVAATRMRDRCVTKVKSIADSYKEQAEHSNDDGKRRLAWMVGATEIIATELQSLTLEGEQEK